MINQQASNRIHSIDQRVVAIIEVLLVFLVTFSLIWIAWILHSKPTTALVLPAFLGLVPLAQSIGVLPEKLVRFLFYLHLLGHSEEFLFRVYIREKTSSVIPPAILHGLP